MIIRSFPAEPGLSPKNPVATGTLEEVQLARSAFDACLSGKDEKLKEEARSIIQRELYPVRKVLMDSKTEAKDREALFGFIFDYGGVAGLEALRTLTIIGPNELVKSEAKEVLRKLKTKFPEAKIKPNAHGKWTD